jgi:hypothetical protein
MPDQNAHPCVPPNSITAGTHESEYLVRAAPRGVVMILIKTWPTLLAAGT